MIDREVVITMRIEHSLAWIAFTALALAGGCSGGSGAGDGGGPGIVEGSASMVIGPEGGMLELQELTLRIPPGALANDTVISVEARELDLADFEAVSAAYVFSPSGLVFDAPAQLEIDLSVAAAGARLYHGQDLSSVPSEVTGASIEGDSVSASIEGFSYYVVGRRGMGNPIIDVVEGFVFEGAMYTAGPVAQGFIQGFSYTFAAAAGISDGEANGHVWYGDGNCMTFRPDGTGVLDRAGGKRRRLSDFPWKVVEPAPGSQISDAPGSTGLGPVGHKILDPEYDRTSELVAFRWGVRLADDGTIYKNFFGNYETRVEFADGSEASTLAWDPSEGAPASSGGRPTFTPELPEDSHFCFFRETMSTSLADQHRRCVESIEAYSGGLTFTKITCYARGMMTGPYTMRDDANGVEIESGTFEGGKPVGGWSFRTLEGMPRANGSFNEHGLHQGKWSLYDYEGNLDTVAHFKGSLSPTDRGTYEHVLDGPFEDHTSYLGTAHLAESGSLVDGKRSGRWQLFNENGFLAGEDVYDLATQLPAGEHCFTLAEGGFRCVPVTSSWRSSSIRFLWPDCAGNNTWILRTYNMNNSVVSSQCHELLGTRQEPMRGPMKECGSVCAQ